MKKLFSILLLATMMLYSVGFYVAYRYNINTIKKEMRSAIASSQYHPDQVFTIEIPVENNRPVAKGFERVDEHEFRYNGEMYDIVKSQWQSGKVIYTCISDNEETHLIMVFADEVQKQTDHPVAGKKAVTLVKFSFTGYTVSESIILPVFQELKFPMKHLFISCKLSPAYQNIPSPPPWLS